MSQSPEQIKAHQKQQAERDTAARKAALKDPPKVATGNGQETTLPAVASPTAVAVPDNRTEPERLADLMSPSFAPGPIVHFNGKDGHFAIKSTGEKLKETTRYIARVPDSWNGWVKFNGAGVQPDRIGGLPYDGYVMPPRESLGDLDPSAWPMGLNGQPSDPQLWQIMMPLQDVESGEIYTFGTTNATGRTAVGALWRSYNRRRSSRPGELPVVQLKPSSYQHRQFGKVSIPTFVVVGWAKEDEAKPLSLAADMNDEIPY